MAPQRLPRQWCLPPSHKSAPWQQGNVVDLFVDRQEMAKLKAKLDRGNHWESLESIFRTKDLRSVDKIGPITQSQGSQGLRSNFCHSCDHSVWLASLTLAWIRIESPKRFSRPLLQVCYFFNLAGKDPQVLRVLKWHLKLNNLHSTHSTGREC